MIVMIIAMMMVRANGITIIIVVINITHVLSMRGTCPP